MPHLLSHRIKKPCFRSIQAKKAAKTLDVVKGAEATRVPDHRLASKNVSKIRTEASQNEAEDAVEATAHKIGEARTDRINHRIEPNLQIQSKKRLNKKEERINPEEAIEVAEVTGPGAPEKVVVAVVVAEILGTISKNGSSSEIRRKLKIRSS
jgi:hypothetical protein